MVKSIVLYVAIVILALFSGCDGPDKSKSISLKTDDTMETKLPDSRDGIVKVLITGEGRRQPVSMGPEARAFSNCEFSIEKIIVEPRNWNITDEVPLVLHPDPGKINGCQVYIFISADRNWKFADVAD